jgi:hypothetical protein
MNFDECVGSVAVESLSDPVSEIEDADGNAIQSESVSTCNCAVPSECWDDGITSLEKK